MSQTQTSIKPHQASTTAQVAAKTRADVIYKITITQTKSDE